MTSVSYIVRKAPDFFFVVPLWLLAALAFRGIFDHGEPEWDYLWDDRKNYVNNLRVHSLSFSNIYWAFTDGVVLGVYEPVSLIIKQVLHTFISVDARTYRLITFSVHAINIYLVFHVSRSFLVSVSDYTFYHQKLVTTIAEEEERLVPSQKEATVIASRSENTSPHVSPRLRKSKKMNKESGAIGSGTSFENVKYFLENMRAELSRLQTHEALGTVGCMLGSGVFAVHPFQAQTIGWISCLPYCLSCFFSLLSFNEYIAHRSCLREWRRSTQLQSNSSKKPWFIIQSKKKKSSSIDRGNSETWLLTIHKAFALVFYSMATFCKAPAVVLPLVYVIIDVYVYSSPLSVHEEGPSFLSEAVGVNGASSQSHKSSGLSCLLPNRLLSRFIACDFSVLWKLTKNAVKAEMLFFALTALSMVYLVGGNSKTILDPLTPWQKSEKAALALMWYIFKFFVPTQLVAAVEMHSFSFLDHWEVAISLVLVPYGTLAILAHSTSSTPRRLLACAWGVFIALLLPSLGFIQHGRMFLAADRYMYMPLIMMAPIVGALTSAWFTATIASGAPVASKFVHAGGPILVLGSTTKARQESGTGCFIDASIIFDRLNQKGKSNKSRGGKEVLGSGKNSNKKKVTISVMTGLSCLTLAATTGFYALSLTPVTLFYWRQSGLLWQRNVEVIPDSENAHVNLSAHYGSARARDLDKALFHAKAADALRPNHAKYQYNVAEVYRMMQKNEEAKNMFYSILQSGSPRWLESSVHYSLGLTLRAMGQLDASKQELELAASMGKTQARSELDKLSKQKS